MTSLMSWISFSDTGEAPELPRALYLASDSRITWGSSNRRWEGGRKVFASATEPHMFGYCGDVVLPALLLGQLVSAIDAGILFRSDLSSEARHLVVARAVERSVKSAVETPTADFEILHLTRALDWPSTSFRAWSIKYDAASRIVESTPLAVPSKTGVVTRVGSGRGSTKNHDERWSRSASGGTSRSYFSSFCDAIASDEDPLSGGPPQLAALYTKGAPRQIGICMDKRRFLNGLEVEADEGLNLIEWRDRLAQRVDPKTFVAVAGGRKFARPDGVETI